MDCKGICLSGTSGQLDNYMSKISHNLYYIFYYFLKK